MDFRYLEVFVSVVDNGTFSKAARALHLTQPTISSHVDSLEKELGVTLFERKSRQAILTEAGNTFYPFALEMLKLKQQGTESILQYKSSSVGKVSIAASSTSGAYLLPPLISSFSSNYGGVDFEVSISDSYQAVTNVLNYQAEIGIIGFVYKSNTLNYIPLFEDEMVLIVPNRPEYARLKDTVTIDEIRDLPFVLRRKGSASRKTFEQALKQAGSKIGDLDVIIETDCLEGTINCVREGLGVSIVSKVCISNKNNLHTHMLADLNLKRTYYATYQKSRSFSPVAENFIQHLTSKAIS